MRKRKKAARFFLPPSGSRHHRSGKPKDLRCSFQSSGMFFIICAMDNPSGSAPFTLPLQKEAFDDQTTSVFFDNLLPPDVVRKRLGKILHLSRHNILVFSKLLVEIVPEQFLCILQRMRKLSAQIRPLSVNSRMKKLLKF